MTLGIDIGTTSSKAVLVDESMATVASARVGHSVDYPRPGYAEQDSSVWWRDIESLIASLSREADLSLVRAVGISSMGPVVLPVSKDGEPLRSAMLYGIDSRATTEIDRLNLGLGGELGSRILTRYSTQSMLPKMLWLKERQPEVYARTGKVLAANGYIVFKLTGRMALDRFTASAGSLVDFVAGGTYSRSFAEASVDPDLVPDLLWPGEIAGTITRRAAQDLGLPAGIPVIAGTTDAAAEAAVCGCVLPCDAALSLGGTTIYVSCRDDAREMDDVFICEYLSPGSYIYGGATGSGGLLFDWFARNILRADPAEAASSFHEEALRDTSVLFLPYLNGARTPLNDPSAKGLITGLVSSTGTDDLYIALLEALAFDLAMMVSRIEGAAPNGRALRVTGGGSRNGALLRIIAETLERDLEVLPPERGSAAGAALLAAVAVDRRTVAEAARSVPVASRVLYSGGRSGYLAGKRDLFVRTYQANKALFAAM
jgi:xylulokinase